MLLLLCANREITTTNWLHVPRGTRDSKTRRPRHVRDMRLMISLTIAIIGSNTDSEPPFPSNRGWMPQFSTRGHLGPGFGRPVPDARPSQNVLNREAFYSPVPVDVFQPRKGAHPHTTEILEAFRSGDGGRRSPDASSFAGRVSPVSVLVPVLETPKHLAPPAGMPSGGVRSAGHRRAPQYAAAPAAPQCVAPPVASSATTPLGMPRTARDSARDATNHTAHHAPDVPRHRLPPHSAPRYRSPPRHTRCAHGNSHPRPAPNLSMRLTEANVHRNMALLYARGLLPQQHTHSAREPEGDCRGSRHDNSTLLRGASLHEAYTAMIERQNRYQIRALTLSPRTMTNPSRDPGISSAPETTDQRSSPPPGSARGGAGPALRAGCGFRVHPPPPVLRGSRVQLAWQSPRGPAHGNT